MRKEIPLFLKINSRRFREIFCENYLDVDGHAVEDGDIATGGVVELPILQLNIPLQHNYFILHCFQQYISFGPCTAVVRITLSAERWDRGKETNPAGSIGPRTAS